MAVFLQVLKIIGIVVLCILALLLLCIFLILFVPIRYRISGERKIPDDAPVRVKMKITWLLHLVSASFLYPEQQYLKVKVLGITVYSTEKKEDEETQEDTSAQASSSTQEDSQTESEKKSQTHLKEQTEQKPQNMQEGHMAEKEPGTEDNPAREELLTEDEPAKEEPLTAEAADEKEDAEEDTPTLLKFFRKLWDILKNIKYTIQKIYDKIKDVINHIRYYIAVIQSETFQRAFLLCKEEIFSLLYSIRPRKLTGDFVIGTGDPASTAQVLAIHGILYPLIGNHITITPDFDNSIIKGDFFIKGKITVFTVLKAAIKLYFNKDVKRVIRLLKREDVKNGRK